MLSAFFVCGNKIDITQNCFAFLAACAELTRARSTSPEWISALRLVAWESQQFCFISQIAFCNRMVHFSLVQLRRQIIYFSNSLNVASAGEGQRCAPASLRCFVAKTCPRKLRSMSFLQDLERVLRPRKERSG